MRVPSWYEVWALEPSYSSEKIELWITKGSTPEDLAEAHEFVKNYEGGPDYRDFEIRECWTLHGWDKQCKVIWPQVASPS
jgi:hypothetical protein